MNAKNVNFLLMRITPEIIKLEQTNKQKVYLIPKFIGPDKYSDLGFPRPRLKINCKISCCLKQGVKIFSQLHRNQSDTLYDIWFKNKEYNEPFSSKKKLICIHAISRRQPTVGLRNFSFANSISKIGQEMVTIYILIIVLCAHVFKLIRI